MVIYGNDGNPQSIGQGFGSIHADHERRDEAGSGRDCDSVNIR